MRCVLRHLTDRNVSFVLVRRSARAVKLPCNEGTSSMNRLLTLFVVAYGIRPTLQQPNSTIVLSAQHLRGAVQLVRDGGSNAVTPAPTCSGDVLFSTKLDSLALPTGSRNYTISVATRAAVSPSLQSRDDVLFAIESFAAISNIPQGWFTLTNSNGNWVRYSLAAFRSSNTTVYSLTVADRRRLRVCFNYNCPSPSSVTGLIADAAGWVTLPESISESALELNGITLGSNTGVSVDAAVLGVWVFPEAVLFDSIDTGGAFLTDFLNRTTARAASPAISLDSIAPHSDLEVDTLIKVTVTAAATAANSALGVKLRLTFYGVSPSNCQERSCGDVVSEFHDAAGKVQGSTTVKYSRAGRYIVRAQASDMMGGWSSRDFELIVHKVGDNQGRAPCCRTTAQVIAQQLGRPIDTKSFRPAWINSTAPAVGWDRDYLMGPEDLEAERLFDYGLLAPINTGPWTPFSCNDKYLAGYGSPTAWGTASGAAIGRATNQGRNKRVAILPQGFSWASNPSGFTQQLPTCVTHWSNWIASTPYGRLNPSTGAATCSYTCTPDGVQQLVSVTGTYDRWAEAIIENSYGALSLLADPMVLPTLYMPKGANAGQNAFAYSEAPINDFLQGLGYDLQNDFHTILVLSPLPRFVNSGFTAWANAGGSPFIFVMRCNPQHYYLVHEYGHRVGMSHATVYKLDASAAAVAPTSPLGPGVMEDTYSDRLDIMACCKGDYSLQNRILSGWVPGNERVTLSLADLATVPAAAGSDSSSGGPVVRRYMLWPFDRPESKGRLKGVSLRIEDGKILVLGYRSMPYWQDVRIKRSSSSPQSDDRPLAPEHMRSNVAGLSVEYSKRYVDSASAPTWSIRGLLDFNLAFTRFPASLPPKPGAYPADPPGAAFTLLREGDAWLDEEHNLLIAVERVVPCTEPPLVPVYSYSVPNFYGFRGENPGEEQVKRADYSGYAAGIKCLQLRVATSVTSSPGTLDVRVRMQGTDEQNRMILGGDQCGFPVTPRLKLVIPADADIISIVWRDNLNRTLALDTTHVDLPALSPLAEASAGNTDQCNSGCDWKYHVKVLAADGAQTQVDITFGSVSMSTLSMTATYSYYLRRSILQATEFHSIPVAQRAVQLQTSGQGRQLVLHPTALEALGQQAFNASHLPDSTCSNQWTISLNLDIPAAAMQPPSDGSSVRLLQLLKVYASSDTSASAPGWPAVFLKVSQANGTSLLVVWGEGSREQFVTLQAGQKNHIAVTRNKDRLGIWANSEGSWLLDSVWCVPDRQAVNYCSKPASLQAVDTDTTLRTLRLGHSSGSSGILVTSVRVYNYAIPRLSLSKESSCIEESSCGRFLVNGWPLAAESAIPAGRIDLHGAVPSAASTPIRLNSNTHYMLVGPWSECSALCGGGWATREIRCMQLQGSGQPAAQVPLEDCPLGEDMPVSSKQCNTVACPRHSLQVLASQHSTCGRGCTLLGSEVDSAQLVCLNSIGQPQPLAQCCADCTNSSDWTSIPWSNDINTLFNASTSSLGSEVRSLQPVQTAGFSANASLAAMLLQGTLPSVCQSAELCVGSVKWQLGRWSPCSSSCGGGTKRRSATCVSAKNGNPLSDQLCISAIGAVPKEVLTAECGSRPCSMYTWEIGSWSACGGDASFGHSSRTVACMDSKGSKALAASSTQCPSPMPESSVTCLKSSQSAVCRPSFIAETHFGSQDCYGHGTCTMNGCLCQVGWHGQFCEVASSCRGVMSKSDKCCTSGMLDVYGACCQEGSEVDRSGVCCDKGNLDKCGTCGGSSWTVDIMGSCCNGVLDALGSCCSSGAIDECGVCDGDGTSCNLHIRLLVNLPNSTDLTASAAAWSAALHSLVAAAIQQAKASTQLQVQKVSAGWVPVVTPASRLVPTRRLFSDASPADVLSQLTQSSPAEQLLNLDPEVTDSGQAEHCPHYDVVSASLGTFVCNKDDRDKVHMGSLPTMEAEDRDGDAAGARARLLLDTATNSTVTWQAAAVDVLLMAVQPSSSMYATQAASTSGTGGIAVSGLGYALAKTLQASADSSNPAAAADSTVQLQRVLLVQRLGVCGNGLCEVGERSLLNGQWVAIQSALAPCLQDCPFKLSMCPAPLGGVGDSHTECGGNGKCVRSQGVCDCFAGYTGDACDQCEASFWPHNGHCVPQYIQGRNIFDPILLEGQDKFTGLVFFIISAVAGALVLISGLWVLYHWLRFGHIPKALSRRLCAIKATVLGKTAAEADTGVSKKYLLDIELELAGGKIVTVPHPRSDGGGAGGIGVEDASLLSKPGSLHHRTSTIGSGALDGGDGDLLKAIRANMMHDDDDEIPAGVPHSPMKERISHMLGRRVTGGGSRYSSLGGSIDLTQPTSARSSVGKTMSEVYSNIQKRVSVAGSGMARVVSNSVSRLSSLGSGLGSGYQQMMTDEDGHLLMEVPLDNVLEQEQYLDASQVTPEVSASRAELNFSEELDYAANPTVQHLRGSSAGAGAGAVPFRSTFSGLNPSQAAAAAQQLAATNAAAGAGGRSTAAAADSTGDGLAPLGMPRLARIKTKTSRQSDAGSGAAAVDIRGWSSDGGGRPPGGPGLTRLGISSNGSGGGAGGGSPSRISGMPGHAAATGLSSLGLRLPAAAASVHPAATGRGGASGSAQLPSAPSWRTRAEYQAALKQSGGEPVLAPHLLQELKGRKSPSEPGMPSGPYVRDRADLPEFVQTPLSGQEPTNRETLEAFGHRMERWFSPDSNSGSGTTSNDRAHSGTSAAAALAELAVQRRTTAAAAQRSGNPFAVDDNSAAAPGALSQGLSRGFLTGLHMQQAVGWSSDSGTLSSSAQSSQAGSQASWHVHLPRAGSGRAGDGLSDLQLPVSTGLASGSGQVLPGSWLSAGGHLHQSTAAAAAPSRLGTWFTDSTARQTAASPFTSQPGTPGAVQVTLDHLPTLASQPGGAPAGTRSPEAAASTMQSLSGTADGQQGQQQHPQRAASQQHPWLAQAASGGRIMSFKAWHQQQSDEGKGHKNGGS